MADSKISALPASTTPLAGTEVLPIVQGGATKQVSIANVTAGRAVATGELTATKTQNATSTFSFVNSDTTNTSSRTNVKFTAGDRELTFLTINGDHSYVNTTGPGNLYLGSGGTIAQVLASTGIVTMPIYGAGAATFSATGVISSVSDATWKIKDGVPENPDEMLNKLEPGYWYYNDEKKEIFGTERQLGFYAQNVNSAIGPEAAPTPAEITTLDDTGTQVGTGQFRPWGYYDRSVLAVTVMSLQKALAAIEVLKTKVAALEARA
jgi:hypothetical protein